MQTSPAGASGGRSGRMAALLAEGAREHVALVAANDYLLSQRGGQVSSEAAIISVDPVDGVVRVTRFARAGAWFHGDGRRAVAAGAAPPLGVYRGALPVVDVAPIGVSVGCLVASEGVREAGGRTGNPIDACAMLALLGARGGCEASHAILPEAIAADGNLSSDAMALACATFAPADAGPSIRRVDSR